MIWLNKRLFVFGRKINTQTGLQIKSTLIANTAKETPEHQQRPYKIIIIEVGREAEISS